MVFQFETKLGYKDVDVNDLRAHLGFADGTDIDVAIKSLIIKWSVEFEKRSNGIKSATISVQTAILEVGYSLFDDEKEDYSERKTLELELAETFSIEASPAFGIDGSVWLNEADVNLSEKTLIIS